MCVKETNRREHPSWTAGNRTSGRASFAHDSFFLVAVAMEDDAVEQLYSGGDESSSTYGSWTMHVEPHAQLTLYSLGEPFVINVSALV